MESLRAKFKHEYKPKSKLDENGSYEVVQDQFAFVNWIIAELVIKVEDLRQAVEQSLTTPDKLAKIQQDILWSHQQIAELKQHVK